MKSVNLRSIVILSAAGAALVLMTAGGIFAGQTVQPSHDAHKAPASASSVEKIAKARLAAVERVCNILHDREAGEPVAHQGVEHPYLWSYRRMEAQWAVENDKQHGVGAIESHLQRMRDLAKHIADAKAAYSTIEVASTEYYVAEAEDLLARAKTK